MTCEDTMTDLIPDGYRDFLQQLKDDVRSSQLRATLSVNRELVLLYWRIGRQILERQERQGWGAKVIERLSADLRREFPEMKGLSARNLVYMQTFAAAWPDQQFTQQVVAQLPWGHQCSLLDKITDRTERLWYLQQTIEHGWSRSVLVHQIESGLYRRQGKALTNFTETLPAPQSDLAQELLKDPYNFDFLTLGEEARERNLHRGLLDHVQNFLLELGAGFALVGSQYPLKVGASEFYPDLLFYHLKLRCFVVIELKVVEFAPEFAGKMNFYLSAIDGLLRTDADGPSVGLILCRSRDKVVAEYALRDVRKPIGISLYRLNESLPAQFRQDLPSIEMLETELTAREQGGQA